jgi:GTP-binding protein
MDISAASSLGVRELMYKAAELLRDLPPIEYYESEYVAPEPELASADDIDIAVIDGVYCLEGEWLEKIMSNINFDDYEQRLYFERALKRSGVYERLEKMGISEGDTVSIYNLEFEYVK